MITSHRKSVDLPMVNLPSVSTVPVDVVNWDMPQAKPSELISNAANKEGVKSWPTAKS